MSAIKVQELQPIFRPDDIPDKDATLPWAAITYAVSALQFGSVTLKVHDGRVTNIERVERIRVA